MRNRKLTQRELDELRADGSIVIERSPPPATPAEPAATVVEKALEKINSAAAMSASYAAMADRQAHLSERLIEEISKLRQAQPTRLRVTVERDRNGLLAAADIVVSQQSG